MYRFFNDDILNVIDKLDNDYDIVFTSPPYNLEKNNFGWKAKQIEKQWKYKNKKDLIVNYVDFLEEVITKLLDKCEYFFLNVQSLGPNKKDLIELQYRLKDYYCDTIIWNKKNGIPNGFNERVMTNVFEYIHIYSLKPSRAVGTKEWRGNVKNVIDINGNQRNKYSKIHKAMFPLELADYILKTFVKENGKVLDCFGGIGTTAVASFMNNLKCDSVEINYNYHELAKQRLQNFMTCTICGDTFLYKELTNYDKVNGPTCSYCDQE